MIVISRAIRIDLSQLREREANAEAREVTRTRERTLASRRLARPFNRNLCQHSSGLNCRQA